MGHHGNNQQHAMAVSASSVSVGWSGPLPPPAALEGYRQLVPDAPERILAMAEEESRIRRDQMQKDHDSENRAKESDIKLYHSDIKRGQIFAFIILFIVLGGVIVLAMSGHDKVAICLAGIGLTGIITSFVASRRK